MPQWEPLGGGAGVWISQEHRFGQDALLLARFSLAAYEPGGDAPHSGKRAAAKPPARRAVDLGAGCGILAVLWCLGRPELTVDALEIQPAAAELAKRSAQDSGFAARLRVHTADLRRWREWLEPGTMDLAAINPPYFPPGSGGVSPSPAARIARHETADPSLPGCTLADAAQAAAGLLRPGGRFCLCHRPERLTDVLAALRGAGLEPKRLRFAQPAPDKAPWLFLCEGRKGGRPGGLRVEAPLLEGGGS
ncbi:MAG TPA: methyltransferase [Firmicutes bacterium]|nr:methyltransferase [Bacillota bacterium]